MRNVVVVVLVAGLLIAVARSSSAQDPERQGTGSGSGTASTSVSTSAQSGTVAQTRADLERYGPKFVRSLTNVQVELTITDQTGTEKPEKKTVSMVVSSGNWGKIRSSGSLQQVGDALIGVDLNVDARPFVSVDGPIQLELTLNYVPPGMTVPGKDNATMRTGLNQSLTVVLQTGKPLIVSQAADPVSDRKVVVEVKATVLE